MTVLVVGDRHAAIDFPRWSELLDSARRFGWEPMGTRVDGAGAYWSGEYWHHGFYPVYMTGDDAAALAVALERKLRVPGRWLGSDALARNVARLCSLGVEVELVSEEVEGYCHCLEPRAESLWFERLSRARTSPWQPRPDFNPYLVFGAVRAQAHGDCWARHLETKEALAQAICGHLDQKPANIALTDPGLLAAVEHEFYPRMKPHSISERSHDTARPNGAYMMLRNGRERMAWARPAKPMLPALASQGPWWRAAQIMPDHDIALIAAGVEWLYQQGLRTGSAQATFGYAENPPIANIPRLDLARVRKDIFGGIPEHWPGRFLPGAELPSIAELEEDDAVLSIADADRLWAAQRSTPAGWPVSPGAARAAPGQ